MNISIRSASPLIMAATVGVALGLFPGPTEAISTKTILSPSGENSGDGFGQHSAGAGDFNGDGFADIIVGAEDYGTERGRAYIIFGGPDADNVIDVFLTGEADFDRFGNAVDGAGDVNADGYDDVIVGAASYSVGGRAYVYFGGPQADNVADLIVDGASGDNLGITVSGAGDVNGDGYDDFLIGAYSAGAGNEGQVFLFHGGPSVNNVADQTFTGEASNDSFGRGLDAGDINGDGYSDVLVGAIANASGGANAGRAYVFLGGPSSDNLADLVFTGLAFGDLFGHDLSVAGDIDGDGYNDIVVGAWGAGGNSTGQAYLFLGGPLADDVSDLTLTGEAANNFFGFNVGGAGDLNADGYDDFVVGARDYDNSDANVGRAYVYFGGPGYDGIPDIVLTGTTTSYFGQSVGSPGDVDGDGVDDLLIGARQGQNDSGTGTGRVYVYSAFPYEVLSPNGGEHWVAGAAATVRWAGKDAADLSLSVNGGLSWTTLATAVGGKAVNAAKIIVPSVATDAALVRLTYTGQAPGVSNSDASDNTFRIVDPVRAPAAHAFRLAAAGEAADDRFGNKVAGAGDVNADGFEDFLVAAPNNDAGGAGAGRVYVFFGGPGSDSTPDLTLTGEVAGDSFGASVASAGDVNGDGYDDFLVGASLNDEGASQGGKVYLYFGGPALDGIADLTYLGLAFNDRLGYSLNGAGDVNGDGYDDVLVGGNFGGAGTEGIARLYFGGPLPDNTADLNLGGEANNDQFGSDVVGRIDLNADGYTDFAVSARLNEAGGSDRGRIYVYYGGPGLDGIPDRIINGQVNFENLGYRLAGGDVNGDGLDDLVASAWSYNPGGSPDRGRVLVYFGGAGFDTQADLILVGEATSNRFGSGLAVADLTGDGAVEILVGAYLHDNAGGTDAGRAYVFYGGPAVDSAPDVVLDGPGGGDWFGVSLGAGDLNADGFFDVFVGADDGGSGGADPGQVHVYDSNRYLVQSPVGGETWDVGSLESIEWLGAEPADLWLSVDGGNSYSLLKRGVGGSEFNAHALTVPHQPTRFAKIKVTPTDGGVNGSAESDSLYTIEASISVLMLAAQPGTGGGILLSWSTDPGPEDLTGYRIDRARGRGGAWDPLVPMTRETTYLDQAGRTADRYRLFAVNGLGEEFLLGETTVAPRAALSAWPLPYRSGDLSIAFATFGGRGGGSGAATVGIFDLNGRLIKTIAEGDYTAGVQAASWDGRDGSGRPVASGVYFLRSTTAGESSLLRLVVVR